MSQADELLETMSDEDILAQAGNPAEEGHIIINSDRTITVPEELKRIAVQYDHNIETVTFDCPRYWDGIDMSLMQIYINYKCPDNTFGSYLVEPAEVTIDGANLDVMHFTWTISRNLTKVKGNLMFLVCAKQVDDEGNEEYHWNSELCRDLYISEGLDCETAIVDDYPDIITQLLVRMDHVEARVYIPSVDANGNISWSNTEGMVNPPSANIKGPKGDKGDIGETGYLEIVRLI